MLGHGNFHKLIPREREANLRMRLRVLSRCRKSERYRKAVIEACRTDIIFYINLFVWQFSPVKKGKDRVGPFISWDYQEASLLARPEAPIAGGPPWAPWRYDRGILWCYENDKTCVVEKSRDMGASWEFLILQDWLCQFHHYVQLLDVSRSAEMVDSASPNSLFWKIRFMHERIPDWLKGSPIEQSMFFRYPKTNSIITGEASTGRAGVGGRASVIFIDEFSQIKEDKEVRERTASTADCRFFNGTHVGLATEFYQLTREPEIIKMRMHWTQHPDKNKGCYRVNTKGLPEPLDRDYQYPAGYRFVLDRTPLGGPYPGIRSPWYDQKCKDIGTARGIAQDLDINPEASVSQFFEAQVILRLSEECVPPFWVGDVRLDPETKRVKELYENSSGLLKLWTYLDGLAPPPSAYGIGCDISHGTGATPSCLSILDMNRGVKIGEYRYAEIKPDKFGELAVALCMFFKDAADNPAYLIWEDAGPTGTLFKGRVIETGFRNFYYRENDKTAFQRPKMEVPGWYPTEKAKVTLLTEYQKSLRQGEFVNLSEAALEECLKYRWKENGSGVTHPDEEASDPSGAGVNHGDLVIADALVSLIGKGKSMRARARDIQQQPVSGMGWRRELRKRQQESNDPWKD